MKRVLMKGLRFLLAMVLLISILPMQKVNAKTDKWSVYERILSACSVTLSTENGQDHFTKEDTSAVIRVKLDESLADGCYMTVYEYPGNGYFDPDNDAVNYRLFSKHVTDAEEITASFKGAGVPLKPGYKIIASLNVCVDKDSDFYRPVTSDPIDVLDENGSGTPEYEWPHANIVEEKLTEGATSAHLTLSGDARLFESSNVEVTCIVQAYPENESFNLDEPYMIPLYSEHDVKAAFDNKEVFFREPVKAGYRVRTIVYWTQYAPEFVPKGNDYENAEDNSVEVVTLTDNPDDSGNSNPGQDTDKEEDNIDNEKDEIKIITEKIETSTTSLDIKISGHSSFEGGRMSLIQYPDGVPFDPDSARAERIYGSAFSQGLHTILLPEGKKFKSGYNVVIYLYKYDAENDRIYDKVSDPVKVDINGETDVAPEVKINTMEPDQNTKTIWATTVFDDNVRAGYYQLYEYYGEKFDIDSQEKKMLAVGAAKSSSGSQRIDIDADNLPLSEGSKLILVLYLRDTTKEGFDFTKYYSNIVTVVGEPELSTPYINITNKKITTGITHVNFRYGYDKRNDSANYSLLYYPKDKDASLAEVIVSSDAGYSGSGSAYIPLDKRPLKAGYVLQLRLDVLKNGKTVTVYSLPVTIEDAPDFGTPSIKILNEKLTSDTKEIEVDADYSEKYLDMEDFYSNITLYQIPGYVDISDGDEVWERPDAIRLGSVQNKRGKVSIVLGSKLEPGYNVIAKLRLPHTEWEGEEADYLSDPVKVEERTVALLYNLPDTDPNGRGIRNILNERNILVKTVEENEVDELVGYLAGIKGYNKSMEVSGDKAPKEPLLLMCGFSDDLLDDVLYDMKSQNISIGNKAILTDYNKDYTFRRLVADIAHEHLYMTAYDKLSSYVEECKKVVTNGYTTDSVKAFKASIMEAEKVLMSGSEEADLYEEAYNKLNEAYKKLQKEIDQNPESEVSNENHGTTADDSSLHKDSEVSANSINADSSEKIDPSLKKTGVKSLSAKNKSIKVEWTKRGGKVKGYEIEYSTDKKFKEQVKTITIKKNKTTTVSIKKLKHKTKYFVRIRTYTKDGNNIVYSKWSKVKSVRTK